MNTKNNYYSPLLELVSVKIEKGFATSFDGSGIDDMDFINIPFE